MHAVYKIKNAMSKDFLTSRTRSLERRPIHNVTAVFLRPSDALASSCQRAASLDSVGASDAGSIERLVFVEERLALGNAARHDRGCAPPVCKPFVGGTRHET
jgi:hypothetical protein